MRAGVLPFFGLSEISILSGIRALWPDAPLLAGLIAVFALVVPLLKTVALILIALGRLPRRLSAALAYLGKLAMADVFLIALYIIVVKGTGLGHVEPAWGLYLFTACVLTSLGTSLIAQRHR